MSLEVNRNEFYLAAGKNKTVQQAQSQKTNKSLFGNGFKKVEKAKTGNKKISSNFTLQKSYVDKNDYKFNIGKDNKGNIVIRRDFQGLNSSDEATGMFDSEEVRSSDGNLVSVTLRRYSEGKVENYFDKHIFDENGIETKVIYTKTDASGNIIEEKEMTPEEYLKIDPWYEKDIYAFKRGEYQGKEHILPTQKVEYNIRM